MKFIDEISLEGKRVLMRVDFNVPLDENCDITDDSRIKAALPSIRHALFEGARLVICSHLGRPKGRHMEEFSLKPVARRLGELLDRDVPLAPDCVGDDVANMVNCMKDGDVLLLENLRFHSGETENSPEFASALAWLADTYVNDAFAVSHRKHASVSGVPLLVRECAAGFLVRQEIEYFRSAMYDPARPLVALIGGAKVSGKLQAIENLLDKVDRLIIGGAMANTFLLAKGVRMGSSLVESGLVETAKALLDKADNLGVKVYLPVDCLIARGLSPDSFTKTVSAQEIPDGWMALDIGPSTARLYGEALEDAKTIVWNGLMGAFETEPFSHGTFALAKAVGRSRALTIVGGGDTGLAVHMAGQVGNVSYVSTGGGAFLCFLEGKELPGLSALVRQGVYAGDDTCA